ncbi:MAG TPA: cyanophycinase, partial [Bdellovibrionales bacterium]|nr:cyanophycinase [Bdellovibrionales bacterium]
MSARAGAPAKKTPKGTLIIIGGSEDKAGEMAILSDIARRVGKGKLVLITVASEEPEHVWATYDRVFRALGVKNIEHLGLSRRAEVMADPHLKILKGAKVIFFSGGDQLKLCSELGGTPVSDKIREMYWSGATIAGTSAGATAIGEIMVFGGPPLDGDKFQLAQGLRLLPGTIIDQHFLARSRQPRLIAAVNHNPALVGIGIDEGTALVVS